MKHELTQEEILVEIKDILLEYVEIARPLPYRQRRHKHRRNRQSTAPGDGE